jgi:hypothetical protein
MLKNEIVFIYSVETKEMEPETEPEPHQNGPTPSRQEKPCGSYFQIRQICLIKKT